MIRLDNMIHMITAHCEGVCCDVAVGGFPKIAGSTVLEKKKYFEKNLDSLRTMLLLEPRGTETENVNVVVETQDPEASFGFLTLEKEELVDMSGGNIISLATVLLETGMIPMVEPVTKFALESASGIIHLEAECENNRAKNVTFTNEPAFVLLRDQIVDVPSIGKVRVDVTWGGMWHMIVNAADLGFKVVPGENKEIVRVGELIKKAAREQLKVSHPLHPEFTDYIQGIHFVTPVERIDEHTVRSRGTQVVSGGYLDRCPCGTATSGRMALLLARGEMREDDTFYHESIIGTVFRCRIAGTTKVGEVPAVIPSVTGRAWITGTRQVGVDPTDPFPAGFTMEALAAGAVATRL